MEINSREQLNRFVTVVVPIMPGRDRRGATGGPVHVRAHTRDGGAIQVDAYDRAPRGAV